MRVRLTVEEATSILDVLGSDYDPIYYRGEETTPRDLAYTEHGSEDAGQVRIQFYGLRGTGIRRRNGTLRTMILDRMGIG